MILAAQTITASPDIPKGRARPMAIASLFRLARAGLVFAQYGVRFVPKGMKVPLALRLAQIATWPVRVITWPFRLGQKREQRMANAMRDLGPSYIKLGQFLATRADVIGPELARDLGHLHDRLPPFSERQARRTIEESLGGKLEDHYSAFGPRSPRPRSPRCTRRRSYRRTAARAMSR